MRIVSLLPSATEILYAVGAGPDVVGVTFECDFPPEARAARIVSTSALPEGLTPAGIDAAVSAALARGEDLYHLDEGALAALDADLVVTQDLCAVCAVDVTVVDDALAHLGCTAQVLTTDPHTLQDVLDSIAAVGAATGHPDRAADLIEALSARIAEVERRVAGLPRPRTVMLEWTDPPFAPGHWLPEMITAAGGACAIGTAGHKSERVSWADIARARPDVVVAAPCGFDLDGSSALTEQLLAAQPEAIPAGTPVWAVDANASYARPGPRLVDGIEALAGILHPDAVPASPLTRRLR